MSNTRLMISATSRENRDETITGVQRAVSESGGWILNVTVFSNISVAFQFEVSAAGFSRLTNSLAAIGLNIDRRSLEAISRVEGERSREPQLADIAGSLQITFFHNEPDLRIPVPPIPG